MSALAMTATRDRATSELFEKLFPTEFDLAFRAGTKQLTTPSKFAASFAIGQKPVAANTNKSSWQNVKQEPADELVSVQFHGRGAGLVITLGSPIVFPAELDLPVLFVD
jgi:hypothetical protein